MQKVQKIGRNDHCWCGSGHKYKDCHLDFDEKMSEYRRKGSKIPTHAMIKNPEQIAAIRESAKINVAVLDYVAEHANTWGASAKDISVGGYSAGGALTAAMGICCAERGGFVPKLQIL